jgi:acyl carrier protein
VNELEVQRGINLSDEQWEEIDAVNQINQMIAKPPKNISK